MPDGLGRFFEVYRNETGQIHMRTENPVFKDLEAEDKNEMQDLLSRLSTDLERFREIDIDHLDDLVDAVKQKDVRFAKSYDDSFPEEDVYTTNDTTSDDDLLR